MKKAARSFLIATLLFCGMQLSAQQSVTFFPKISPPIPVVINSAGAVKVSVIDGLVNSHSAFSLVFENTSDAAVTFKWSLTDADGNVVGEAHISTLAAHEKLDYSNAKNSLYPVVFVLQDDKKYTDYKVEIKL